MPMRVVRTFDSMMSDLPFEVLISFACLISGVPMALGVIPSPGSLISELPLWAVRMWGALIAIGGLLSLAGLSMSHSTSRRRFLEGMYVEGGGVLALGTGSLAFSLAILSFAGSRAIFAIATYWVLAMSCFFRFRTLRRTVKKMKEAIDIERELQRGG